MLTAPSPAFGSGTSFPLPGASSGWMVPPAETISLPSRSASGVRTSTDRSELLWMNSLVLLSAISLPRPMTIRWSAVTAISLIRWLDTKIVRPSFASCRMRVRTHLMPSGSSPLTGSSSSITAGLPSIAAAMPSRCVMPSENPPGSEPLGLGKEQQVVPRAAARMQCPRLQQRAHDVQRPRQLLVGQPADGRRPAVRPVQPADQPHRGRLPRPVGPEEAGHPARLDRERQVIHGHLVAESLRQLMRFDKPRGLGHVLLPVPSGARRSGAPPVTRPSMPSHAY